MRNQRKLSQKPRVKKRRKKICVFCAEKKGIDYKDTGFVRKFTSDRGKILSRRTTGCCALHQRMISKVIGHSRQSALVPYTVE